MMVDLRSIAVHWYRKAFGAPAGADIRDEGLTVVLDGSSAVAMAEAALASRVVESAEGPRGIVAAATGLALAGRRATAPSATVRGYDRSARHPATPGRLTFEQPWPSPQQRHHQATTHHSQFQIR